MSAAWRIPLPMMIHVLFVLCVWSAPLQAQTADESLTGARIEAVRISLLNPSQDPHKNRYVEDQVRAILAVFPSESFSPAEFDSALSRARRTAGVARIDYDVGDGVSGGVVIDLSIELKDSAEKSAPEGLLVSGSDKGFPLLYSGDAGFLKIKLEYLGMHYSNTNAWYGRPDLVLAGNPMVQGTPSGKGFEHWAEGFVHLGIYGLRPLSPSFYLYGGLSSIGSGSYGQELFTDKTRSHFAVEDAYAGFISGHTDTVGNRFVINVLGGRKRFSLGDGMLLVNTSANGHERAALQSNPRWAADQVLNLTLQYNKLRVEFFRVDPDEMPIVDSRTIIHGVNAEIRGRGGFDLGASHLWVPKSDFGYFTPGGKRMSRDGLRVADLRLRWQPNPAGQRGPWIAAEYARQRHSRIDMHATGAAAEVGWSWAEAPWRPSFSYRLARFSGDDPATARFERWDPLFSGGNGEQWIQGINHFKVFQDSNLLAHRFQWRMRPTPRFELVPQIWIFRAASTNNLGGNPALSFLDNKDLATEWNLTAKVFKSRRTYIQGHVAMTRPGDAVRTALGSGTRNWWSTMFFIRVAL